MIHDDATQIEMLFAGAHRQGRKMLTHGEMATVAAVQGVTRKQLDIAISDGDLRKGVDGYWLPEAPDPGAIAVMRAAMRDRDYSQEAA